MNPWLTEAKKADAFQTVFKTIDDQGRDIFLDWSHADIQSQKLSEFKQSICGMASEILAPAETEFLRTHPEALSQELFLKSCAPFFEKGLEFVDWKGVEDTIKTTIKQFYSMDLSKFGAQVIEPLLNDVYFLVKAKERENTLGFLMGAITPSLPYGFVKIIQVAVIPEEKNRGLEKALLSLLLKIIPEIKCLFLFVRPTNEKDLNTYLSLGFIEDQKPFQDPNHKINTKHLQPLKYQVDISNVLQNAEKNLI